MSGPSNPRVRIMVLAVPMVALTISLYVGNALAPTLAHDAPVLLLVLSPRLRWLLLTSAQVDALWFFVIPFVRAAIVLSVYFLLGRWYGDRALRWLESRAGNAMRPVLWIERNFHRARGPITFVFPGNVAAMLAGADGMSPLLFFGIALASIELRVWAVRALANAFRGPLLDALAWVGDNQVWLTVVSIATVMGWVMWSNRHGLTQGETVDELVADFDPATDAADG
jgi:hypothetical protein